MSAVDQHAPSGEIGRPRTRAVAGSIPMLLRGAAAVLPGPWQGARGVAGSHPGPESATTVRVREIPIQICLLDIASLTWESAILSPVVRRGLYALRRSVPPGSAGSRPSSQLTIVTLGQLYISLGGDP